MSKLSLSQLPPELVEVIFTDCLPPKPSFYARSAPLLLTHICRSWRQVALESPLLWSTFKVPGWQDCPPGIVELVSLWLSRTGEAPLDIDISMFDTDVQVIPHGDGFSKYKKKLKLIVQALVPHREQIHRLCGVYPDELMSEVGFHDMRNIRNIFYCGLLAPSRLLDNGVTDNELAADEDGATAEDAVLDIGPPREALKQLAVVGCALNIETVKLHTQLTHLELNDLHFGGCLCEEEALGLLTSLPSLKIAVMDITRYERLEFRGTESRIELPNLELLFITWQFPADVSLLLDSIRTPNLCNFGLRGTAVVMPTHDWNSLYNFLNASQAPIQRVSFGDFGTTRFRLLDCLACCPQLEHVTINHTTIDDNVFRTLTCGEGEEEEEDVWDTRLLPCLQILNLGVCEGFTRASLVRFIKSRTRANVPSGFATLSECAILYCPSVLLKDKWELEECGLDTLVFEGVEEEVMGPHARVVETHRELLAIMYEEEEEEEFELINREEIDVELGLGAGSDQPQAGDITTTTTATTAMEGLSPESESQAEENAEPVG